VAKKTRQKASRTKAAKKPTAVGKKVAARRTTLKDVVPKKTTARKSTKKIAERVARKPAKVRVAAKKTRAAQRKTTKRTTPRAAGKAVSASATVGVIAKPLAASVAAPDVPIQRSSGLSKKDLAQFRQLLLTKRVELIGDMSTLQKQALSENRRDAAGDLSSMPIHMADLGTDNYEKEFTLGLIEGERALLREIDEALRRIEDGTYGICEATGKPIGKARLRARPWAKFCYEYVLAQEKGQQTSGL